MNRAKWIVWGVLAAGICGGVANVQAEDVSRVISVSGKGKAAGVPDMAMVTTGVSSQARTAGEALILNNVTMEKIMATLKSFGVAEKDIQTSNFNVGPLYTRDPQTRKQEVTGYEVTNQVNVKVRKLADLGKILDALVSAGSNRINRVMFTMQDSEALMNEARVKAIKDAYSRAKLYAEAAEVQVGAVQTISEQPVAVPRPVMAGRQMAFAEAASAVPVAAGEQEFVVTVNVVYALKD